MQNFENYKNNTKKSEIEEQLQTPEKTSDEEQNKGWSFFDLFRWRMDEKELKYQIDNYKTIRFFKSARGIASAMLIVSVILTLILAPQNWIDSIFMVILALFIYKGSKMALIIAMIYWTYAKGLQFVEIFTSTEGINTGNIWAPVIFWLTWMGAFWQAYQVERAKRKTSTNKIEETGDYIYCQHCGTKIAQDSDFCPQCGSKVIK
ncbi:MAG: zinc ribbon domain-containing protein [Minisyncoccia bacterium]